MSNVLSLRKLRGVLRPLAKNVVKFDEFDENGAGWKGVSFTAMKQSNLHNVFTYMDWAKNKGKIGASYLYSDTSDDDELVEESYANDEYNFLRGEPYGYFYDPSRDPRLF